MADSVNYKKFVKSLQVICTKDSAKVLNPSLCLLPSFRTEAVEDRDVTFLSKDKGHKSIAIKLGTC